MILRHEINILDHELSSLSTGTVQSNELFYFDTTQYNGTITRYLEVVAINNDSTNKVVTLQSSGINITVTVPASTSSYTLVRGNASAFTTAERYLLIPQTTSDGQLVVKSARIIIIQDAATITNTETQIEIGNYELNRISELADDLANPKYWYYDASKWDGTVTFYAEAVYDSGSMDTITVRLGVTTSSDITNPSWDFADIIVNAATTTVPTRTRIAFTPTDQRWYRILSFNGSMDNHDIYRAGIVVQQSGTVTKLEPQYLLANTRFATGTALQLFLTKWDSTEWSGVTNTYYLQAEADNNSAADVELWEADGGGSAIGTVTNIDNAQISAAMTMPASQNLDVKNTQAGSIPDAARILVTVVVAAAVANTGLLPFCISPQGTR